MSIIVAIVALVAIAIPCILVGSMLVLGKYLKGARAAIAICFGVLVGLMMLDLAYGGTGFLMAVIAALFTRALGESKLMEAVLWALFVAGSFGLAASLGEWWSYLTAGILTMCCALVVATTQRGRAAVEDSEPLGEAVSGTA